MYSFEDNGDYVYDVAWSPIHPAVFATVDGMGRLDIWNLNQDTEVSLVVFCEWSIVFFCAEAPNYLSFVAKAVEVYLEEMLNSEINFCFDATLKVPVASVTVEGNPALNRVKWTQSGMNVTVGDDNGKIWLFELGEVKYFLFLVAWFYWSVFTMFISSFRQHLAMPRADEWTRLVYTLQELRQNQLDEDMDKMNFGLSSLGAGSLGIGSNISQLTTSPPSSLSSMSSSSSVPLR